MSIRFIPVTEMNDTLTLSIGISGASGTGKTYTALLIARGIAEVIAGRKGAPIGFVDTENRRALHYRQDFPEMMHFDFSAVDVDGKMIGFPPERWIEVIDAAEAEKLPVLILDSASHAWEGVNGVLELHAFELDRLVKEAEARANGKYTVDPAKFSQLAWAAVKPRYRRLIDRIVRAKCHLIICTRAKPVMQDFKSKRNARPTKTRRADVPWDPATDSDTIFELTTMVILDPSAPGCPVHRIKVADQFKALLDPRRPMDENTGRRMAEWAMGGGDGRDQKAALDEARTEARKGTDAFRSWWQKNPDRRAVANTILSELQTLAAEADADARQSASDDPFSAFDGKDDDPPSGPERAMFDQLAATIIRDAREKSPAEVRDLYADQIAQMKSHYPELHAEVEEALK